MLGDSVGRLCVGFLYLAFVAALAAGQDTSWEQYSTAGLKAYQQNRYAEAERLFLAAVQEAEKFGPDDPRLAWSLSHLATLYRDRGEHERAEQLFRRALGIREKALDLNIRT